MEGPAPWRDRQAWAEGQFGTAKLGDARRTRRLVKVAAQMAGNSNGSIPQQTGTKADMKAAYRLFDAADVTHAAVCGPHVAQTREAASRLPVVFLLQDTMELNLTGHVHCEGLGPIGSGGALRGLHQQNVLAIDPATQRPLGLLYQAHHRRTKRPAGHSRAAKRRVPLTQRESHWWIESIQAIGPPPPGTRWVHVGDRGEDVFGVYDEARGQGTGWLIRVGRDRRVRTPDGVESLFSYARRLASLGQRVVELRDSKTRRVRAARLEVASGPVEVLPPSQDPAYRGCEAVPAWVVRTWEPDPPSGATPVEWILLTDQSAATFSEAALVVEGYGSRWLVEEFHKSEKTGCAVESRRLTHVDRLEPLLGVLSVLAVWLLQLKFVARDAPKRLAADLLDATSVHAMARYLKRPAAALTVEEFWAGIGRLGGHLGRPCDGPLGWLRAWRGWQCFQLILVGFGLRDPTAPLGKCGE